ncbi:MAG: SIMPL domain-containing protein [Nitrososphaerales archaeon]|jgi:uncharacterized protein YggE
MQTAANSRTQKFIAVGAVLALALISLQAYTLMTDGALSAAGIQKASGSTDPPTNSTISVTGNGQVEIQPTMAILTIGVNAQDPSAQTAAQENANIMTNVIGALENLGINSSSIQTVSYSINPQINYDANGKSSVTGYEVDSQVQVTVTASTTSGQSEVQLGTKVGSAIDAAVGQGANEVYGVQFSASSSAVHQADQQALQLAVQDAANQARTIATGLSVTITGVLSVSTSPAYTPSPVIQDAIASGSSQTPIVAPQSLTVSASVQAVYAIS